MKRFIATFVVLSAVVFTASALFAGTVTKTFMSNATAQKQVGELSMYKLVASRGSIPQYGDANVGTPNWYDYANSTDFATGSNGTIFYFQATNASTGADEWVLIDAPNYSPNSFYKLGIPRVGNNDDIVNMVVTGSNVYTSYSSARMPLFSSVTADADGVKSLTNQNIILEFWGRNYSGNAQASKLDQNGSAVSLPTSGTTTGYDWNDTPAADGDHGSYQVHLYDSTSQSGQTLFGLSRIYRTNQSIDAGIGNSGKADALDWTMATNEASQNNRSLQVLAIPNYAEGSLIYSATSGKKWEEGEAWLNPDGTVSAGVPTADTPVHVNAGTVEVTGAGYAQSVSLEPIATIDVKSGGSLTIGSAITTNGTIKSAGAWKNSGNFVLGQNLDSGNLTLTGGTFQAGGIYFSNAANSNATGEITNTTISGFSTFRISNVDNTTATVKVHEGTTITGGDFNVGFRGTGTLYMDGGYIKTSTYFCIGNNVASANGIVYHSGGTIESTWVPLGHNGKGTYNLSGTGKLLSTSTGSADQNNATNNSLSIGDRKGSNVTFNMSGGEMESKGWLYIGRVGTGVLNLSGGTVKATTGIVLGHISDSGYKGDGTINATGGTIQTKDLYIANWTPGAASMKNTTVTLSGNLILGHSTDGVGTLTTDTGTKITSAGVYIGNNGKGTATMTGTTLTTSGTFYVGQNAGAVGDLTVNEGTNITAKNFCVGNKGTGTMTMNGGTIKTNEWFLLGFNNPGVNNAVVQNGGTLDVAWFTMQWDGSAGTSSYTMNGGELISHGTAQGNGMVLARNGNATFNMNGGKVTTSQASATNINWAGYALSVGTGVTNGNAILNISGGEIDSLGKTYIKNGSAINYLTGMGESGGTYGVLKITGDLEQLGAITVSHTGDAPNWVDPVTIMTVSGAGVPNVTNNSTDVYEDFWYLDEKALKLQTKAGTVDFNQEAAVELPEGVALKTGWVDLAYTSGTRSFDLEIATEDMDSFMAALNAQLEAEYGDGATATKKDDQTVEISLNFAELGDLDRFTWNFTGAEFNGAAVTGLSSNYIPEPSTWLLLVLGLGMIARRRNGRR